MQYDNRLGPYPLKTERQWAELSEYVSEAVLRRAGVPVGTFIMPGSIETKCIQADPLPVITMMISMATKATP